MVQKRSATASVYEHAVRTWRDRLVRGACRSAARNGSEEWQRAWRRESRLLVRVRRAAWRREMAELERTWAIARAHGEGVSIRKIAAAAGLGRTRVHAIVRYADIYSLDAALGELRALYGWPAREDPDGSRNDELAGRELIAQRLGDEVE
jgi:hypothetical protein